MFRTPASDQKLLEVKSHMNIFLEMTTWKSLLVTRLLKNFEKYYGLLLPIAENMPL